MSSILITGANKGIGFSLAKVLGQKGNQVLIGARNEQRGNDAVQQLAKENVKSVYIHIDLDDINSLESAAESIEKNYGDLSMLINNAGISGDMSARPDNTDLAQLRETMQSNFFGPYVLTKALIPTLKKNNGRIIDITIPTGGNEFFNPLAYKTSKAALNSMTESLSAYFKKNNLSIRIMSIHLGPTTTDLNENTIAEGFSLPDDVAGKIVKILTDGKEHQGDFVEVNKELFKNPLLKK
ncbi:SDR family NAD(P)-dependent oxidoreductase [Liquorilactobacillus mali]|uniref:SDR family NAD(P)-dependent oxidoreductase n=1 Tax=Liquorilactobacillus mali TaxID=1618 RepID=UPI00235095D3|nr:SDR family NAD(P)-dependent oxidoreductase [Liquorilactobacillus mali]MDC7953487.1 SDR family NAD(P)-dependent oxidoreductase [Liquorilactobacillus mali]